jgi:periplasmic divalent cation tolerance protein
MSSELILIYVPCADSLAAEALGRALVEQQLAACANILPQMTSLYRWEGEVQTSHEAVLLLKTRAALFDACAEVIRAGHSYDIPAILALPLANANEDFTAWVLASVKG